jgi:meiotic recombination protein SPO11
MNHEQTDAVLEDISCMLGCTRSSLNVDAGMLGRLTFSESEDKIDCTKMGIAGKVIPPINLIGDMHIDALFILLVEKEAAFKNNLLNRDYLTFVSVYCIIL